MSFNEISIPTMIFPKSGDYFVPDKFDSKEPICLDIGTSCGGFILKHHRKFHTVYTVEAFYGNFTRAIRVVDAYDVPNVVHFNLALHAETGRLVKVIGDESSNANAYSVSYNLPGSHKILTISLPDLIDLVDEDRIDFLKMDIEGAEHEVFTDDILNSPVLDRIDYLGIEIHALPDKRHRDRLINRLKTRFNIVQVRQRTHPEILFINRNRP